MRRQIKPFTVERKRNARATGPETPDSGAAKDSDPAPPAPDSLLAPPPAPKASDLPHWAAAEALFSSSTLNRAAPASPASGPGGGRILPSLDEPPAPVPHPSYDVDEAPKRRGRKPGSRNKPRDPQQGPKTISTVMRDLFEFWAMQDADSGNAPMSKPPAAAPAAPDRAAPAPSGLRRRGRAVREELPRGQRWKARLPRFAR